MKKIISVLAICFTLSLPFFGKSYKIISKGEVYVKSSDGDMYSLEEGENTVQDDDTIIVGDKTTITIYIDTNKIVIRAPGAYKVEDLAK